MDDPTRTDKPSGNNRLGVTLFGAENGYSRAARAGEVVALSGQTALPEVIEAERGFAAEFDSALARLVVSLEEAGGSARDLLQVRIFVIDISAYSAARSEIGESYRERLGGHYPASTLVEVNGLLGGAQVELEGVAAVAGEATSRPEPGESPAEFSEEYEAVIRLRLAPADARYAGGIAAGSKSMEVFADLETELALHEGGDEGLCVAYDMVEFLAPLRVGDFIEGRARVVKRGRTSRRIAADIHKVASVDERGVLQPGDSILAARASATIVVATTKREQGR